MEIKTISTKDIKPYPKNARIHPNEQITHIANSLKEFGWKQPIVLDKNNVCIVGHGRLEAAKKLKMSEVPVLYADDLTDEQIKAYRLADNMIAQSGGVSWDDSLLNFELESLDFDMGDFGFDMNFNIEDNAELERKELEPYKKVHYLISFDLNIHDKLIGEIERIKQIEGVEIASTLN